MGPTLKRETRLEIVNDPFNAVKDMIRAVWKVYVSIPSSPSLPFFACFVSSLERSNRATFEVRSDERRTETVADFSFPLLSFALLFPSFLRSFRSHRLHQNDKRNSPDAEEEGDNEEMEEDEEEQRPRKFARVEAEGEMEE